MFFNICKMASDSYTSSDCDSSAGEYEPQEHGVRPYMYEPCYRSSECPSDSDNSDHSDSDNSSNEEVSDDRSQERLQNTDWCECGHCVQVDNVIDAVCCQEIPEAVNEIQRGKFKNIYCLATINFMSFKTDQLFCQY